MSTIGLAELAAGHLRGPDRAAQVWELVAFLGRYAHQSAREVLAMPKREAESLARATARLLEQEAEKGHVGG